jgi:hypothetical protein
MRTDRQKGGVAFTIYPARRRLSFWPAAVCLTVFLVAMWAAWCGL